MDWTGRLNSGAISQLQIWMFNWDISSLIPTRTYKRGNTIVEVDRAMRTGMLPIWRLIVRGGKGSFTHQDCRLVWSWPLRYEDLLWLGEIAPPGGRSRRWRAARSRHRRPAASLTPLQPRGSSLASSWFSACLWSLLCPGNLLHVSPDPAINAIKPLCPLFGCSDW